MIVVRGPHRVARKLLWLLCCLVYSLCLLPHQARAQSPAQLFQQAKNTYTFGDYGKAVLLFRKLLYPKPGSLQSKFMRQEAQKYLGISYYYLYTQAAAKATELKSQSKPVPKELAHQQKLWLKRARFELLEFLANEPDATLSPLIYPPDLVSLFNQLRTINQLRLNALNTKKVRRKLVRLKLIRTRLERRLFTTSPYAMLLPCGLAQLANGHTLKGVLVLVGCSATLATNLTAYGILFSAEKEPGVFEPAFIPTARVLRVTHLVAFGALAALVLYGYIDGIYYYQGHRESLIPTLPSLTDKDLSRSARHIPPTPSADSSTLYAHFR